MDKSNEEKNYKGQKKRIITRIKTEDNLKDSIKEVVIKGDYRG